MYFNSLSLLLVLIHTWGQCFSPCFSGFDRKLIICYMVAF